jgi:hypothetical protein
MLSLARSNFSPLLRDKEAQRLIYGHIIHMTCQCDFFSMKSRQHVSVSVCQRMDAILSGWKDAVLSFSPATPGRVQQLASSPSVCVKEWLLLIMLRLVAMHHVLRYMSSAVDANYQDTRNSRDTPEGQHRVLKLHQCAHILKNTASTPLKDIHALLTTYAPIISDLATLHAHSLRDSISHAALATLHLYVSDLLTGARDLIAKSNPQSPNLHSDLKALIQRVLVLRSRSPASAAAAAAAVGIPSNGATAMKSYSVGDMALAAAECETGARNIASPPPLSCAATASSCKDDTPEHASACMRCVACVFEAAFG